MDIKSFTKELYKYFKEKYAIDKKFNIEGYGCSIYFETLQLGIKLYIFKDKYLKNFENIYDKRQ